MVKKSTKRPSTGGIVYSTNPGFFSGNDGSVEGKAIPPSKQKLRVSLDTKNRRGKSVTIVYGFAGSDEEMKDLEKALKQFCGTGGSSKDGEILIQGDQREKVISYLTGKGYVVK